MKLRYLNVVAIGMALASVMIGVSEVEARQLALFNVNTKESLEVNFRTNGAYDQNALKKLNWFFRDWRRNEPTKMDARLFDLLADIHEKSGSGSPIHVLSGYRSPATNSMLRRKSSAVARESQHMEGKAVDFFIPGVPIAELRKLALKEQEGGVGFYPKSRSPFVHVDVASIRAWPRPSRELLVSLFPDGQTSYLPSDGRPLTTSKVSKPRGAFRENGIFAVIGDPAELRKSSPSKVVEALDFSPPIPADKPDMGVGEKSSAQAMAYAPDSSVKSGEDPFEAILETREKLFNEIENQERAKRSVTDAVKAKIKTVFRYVEVKKSSRPGASANP